MMMRNLVKNVGSTARDHLANERTFLAYARTGMGFFGAGLGLLTAHKIAGPNEKSQDIEYFEKKVVPGSWLLLLNGGVFLSFSTIHYFRVQKALERGNFILNRSGLMGTICFTAVNSLVALSLLHGHDLREKINPGPHS